MGMTYVTVHIRKKDEIKREVIKEIVERITEKITDGDCYINQEEFLTIIPSAIEIENVESTAEELSWELAIPVLTIMIFDSEVVVIQLYNKGQIEIEFVKSFEANKDMDIDKFIRILEVDCKARDIGEALSKGEVFAEEILYSLGDVLNVDLLLTND